MTGIAYATSAEMAAELGAFPRFAENREPMLRVMRNHRRAAYGDRTGYEEMTIPPVPLDHKANPDQKTGRTRQARLGPRARARRGARLPQCAGDRGRADRHHRPGHGLRHHRHRARFRAGEVQEARRRRLLQDHQPRRAGSAARARLSRKRHRRDRGLCRRPRLAGPGAGDQPHARSRPRASPTRRSRKSRRRCRPPSTSSSPSTSGRSAKTSARRARHRRRPTSPRRASTCSPHLGFSKREIEAANIHVCGAMTVEGAPHLEARALRRVRLRQSVRPHRQALPLGREPHPHDGGGAAVHLRRHLQDHQHAERGDGRGLQGGLPAVLEARAQSQRALPRRLEAVAAAANRSSSPTRTRTTT